MGRIKTALIKRITNELVAQHREKFKTNFEENKRIVTEFISSSSPKIRNTIAGYVTRLMKKTRE